MNRVVQMLGDLVGKEVAQELDELAKELEERLGRKAIEDEKAGLLLLSVWAARRARGALRPQDLRLATQTSTRALERLAHEVDFFLASGRLHEDRLRRALDEANGVLSSMPPETR